MESGFIGSEVPETVAGSSPVSSALSIFEAAKKTNFVLYTKGDKQFVLHIHAVYPNGYVYCSYFGVLIDQGMEPCCGGAYLSPDTQVKPIYEQIDFGPRSTSGENEAEGS